MKHMKCIAFLRPIRENVELLVQELRNPRYGQYYIYFSNTVNRSDIKELAEADDQECIQEVKEFFGDYVALAPHLFSFNLTGCFQGQRWSTAAFERSVQGLVALLLSLRKAPVVRYQCNSEPARRLAEGVSQWMKREAKLFDFRKPENNRVNLSQVPGLSRDLQDMVLSEDNDEFYSNNMYKNFVESIADMKAFVEHYPQFKKIQGTVAKHVTLVGELSRLVGAHSLLEVSEVEQEIVATRDHSDLLKRVRSLIGSSKVRDIDCLRLVILYALHFDKHSNSDLSGLVHLLKNRGISEPLLRMIPAALDFQERKLQPNDKFSADNVRAFTKKVIKGLKGVENIYTQHVPLVYDILEDLLRGRLRDNAYPQAYAPSDSGSILRYQDITFVSCWGGTCVHNFSSFLDELRAASSEYTRSGRRL
ncbi:hypothetical protein MRX96_022894 [Rhipicephalus microplus]